MGAFLKGNRCHLTLHGVQFVCVLNIVMLIVSNYAAEIITSK